MNILRKIFSSNKTVKESIGIEKFYFKILNFYKLKTNPETIESMQEYDGEYNYELQNNYFKNAWFYSNVSKDLIQFQIFYTQHAHFRNTDFYFDAQSVQDFYKNRYQTPFFYSLSDDELKKKYHPSNQLGEYLNFKDFKSVILPNLNLQLISTINLSALDTNKYYVFYNWDFFEEIQTLPFSNSFIGNIDALPIGSKSSYESKEKALIRAFNVLLENACSTVDTSLKGFYFDLGRNRTRFLRKESHAGKSRVIPAIRNTREIENEEKLINDEKFQNELNALFDLIKSKTMSPFEIIKTGNTVENNNAS